MLIAAAILLAFVGLVIIMVSGHAFGDDQPGIGIVALIVGLVFLGGSVGCVVTRAGTASAPKCYSVLDRDGHHYLAPMDCP